MTGSERWWIALELCWAKEVLPLSLSSSPLPLTMSRAGPTLSGCSLMAEASAEEAADLGGGGRTAVVETGYGEDGGAKG